MNDLHNRLSENNGWYRKWHTMDSHQLIHWLTFFLVLAIAWSLLSQQIYDVSMQADQEIVVNLPNTEATLSLSPKTKEVSVGEIFTVDIILDTHSGSIDGVDIYGLHYDPSILKVVDDLPNKKGVQILPGTIIPNSAVNIVDELTGTIKLGQLSVGGKTFSGRGVLATIHFKALSSGNSYLKFDFSKGSTVDTNAAHRGKDKLSNVVDAIYTVIAK